jgi:hypothetical protein
VLKQPDDDDDSASDSAPIRKLVCSTNGYTGTQSRQGRVRASARKAGTVRAHLTGAAPPAASINRPHKNRRRADWNRRRLALALRARAARVQ